MRVSWRQDASGQARPQSRDWPFEGKFVQFVLYKENRDTLDALTALGRVLGEGRAVSDETAVVEAWRGRGIAAELHRALVERLRAIGVRVLEGETSAERIAELAFFRRQGFRVTGAWFAFGVEGYADGETIFRTEKRL